MNYKIISMDFDGTLLTTDKKVSKKTKDVLLKYKNNGYLIVGITARNLSSVKNVCDINMFNYLILNNGSHIYDVKNNKENIVSIIDMSIVKDITNNFKDIAKEIDYCSLNEYYIYLSNTMPNINFQVKIDSVDEIKVEISRMNIFLKNNEEIDKYKEYIENNYDSLNAFIMVDTDNTNNKWIVINSKKTNKFSSLEKLCLMLNINVDDVIFFGDSTNDLQIINRVGLGVAMGNALKIVKEQAKEVTISNNEDGIAVFLENYYTK